ncbi:MAG TPA: hypothetical protein VKN35_05515, partial [Xanthomonadales bacterium]|nr:hypothetical protein [Xanthomonadales bacterium]
HRSKALLLAKEIDSNPSEALVTVTEKRTILDIAPTLFEAAGYFPSDQLEGISLKTAVPADRQRYFYLDLGRKFIRYRVGENALIFDQELTP